jgi:YVTN family beta-propeller protein
MMYLATQARHWKKYLGRYLLFMAMLWVLMVGFLQAQEGDPLYDLPDAFADPVTISSSMVITNRGRLIVANRLTNSVGVVDALNRRLDEEIAVGNDPRFVALTPDNLLLLVTNRLDGTLSLITTEDFQVVAEYPVGILPYGVVVAPDGLSAYVARLGNSDVVRVDLATGRILEQIPTPDAPVGLALWGDLLYVTHFWTGEISLIYRPQAQVVQKIRLHPQASHAHSMAIDVRNGLAFVPYTISNTQAQFPDQVALPRIGVIDLARMQVLPEATRDLTLADRWLNLPSALTFDLTNNTLFVVSRASNALTILGRDDATASAHLPTDADPRSVIAGRDGVSVYVHHTGAQSIGIYETRFNTRTDTIPTSNQAPPSEQQIGQRIFNTVQAPLTPACSTCHADGLTDRRIWGNAENTRNTPDLLALHEQTLGWQGQWTTLNDLTAHPTLAQPSPIGELPTDAIDTATLVAYLRTLAMPPAPPPAGNIAFGEQVYQRLTCSTCHNTNQLDDVGTGVVLRAPSLDGLWLSAPYFHDGRAETLRDVFVRGVGVHRLSPQQITDDELDALLAYLLTRN